MIDTGVPETFMHYHNVNLVTGICKSNYQFTVIDDKHIHLEEKTNLIFREV